MENKPEKVFVDGINVQFPSDKAPEYILLKMGFNSAKFFRWCQDHQDDKGWVNITIKKSTKGTIYGELDTWKPKPVEERVDDAIQAEFNEAVSLDDIASQQEQDLSEIPF